MAYGLVLDREARDLGTAHVAAPLADAAPPPRAEISRWRALVYAAVALAPLSTASVACKGRGGYDAAAVQASQGLPQRSPVSAVSQTPGETTSALFAQSDRKVERGDVAKLSANELLRILPNRFPVHSEMGDFATVQKFEVPNAKYLFVAIRHIHENERAKREGRKEHPLAQKMTEVSNSEAGQLLCALHRDYGFRYFGSEGFTEPEYHERQQVFRKISVLERRIALLQEGPNKQKAREMFDEVLRNINVQAPFAGFLELELAGGVELVPTESVKASQAGAEEMRRPIHQRMNDREDACLLCAHRALDDHSANRVAMVWGGGHWGKGASELPSRAALWNRAHPGSTFSFAVVTPPSVVEYSEVWKIVEHERMRGAGKIK